MDDFDVWRAGRRGLKTQVSKSAHRGRDNEPRTFSTATTDRVSKAAGSANDV